ncbi:family 1 glycosylhydrolase [Brevibacterium sp.]|uniref:glycoside hydrolase family 1 protein n=1 Tax=Brevibacterium sp. TaxID=1701 RepID=UPI00281179F2|nr:family 1 glycosylhydrolase [Brevibacterium sp.]
MTLSFPPGFLWGTATAAYQIEGAAAAYGRSPSIWDDYLREHGTHGDTGDVACDHYHRWQHDLDLAARLGAGAYRFSASWSRVMPDGRTVNREGLDFYERLVDGLLDRGLTPALTMYHMDLPAHLDGGWSNRDTALRFADYAQVLTETLGDRVGMWMTVNELYYESWVGYAEGAFPPGHRDSAKAVAALHHMLLAHGLGVSAVREHSPAAEVGLVSGYAPVVPATDHPADVAAASTAHTHSIDVVLGPVLQGRYPQEYAEHPARAEALAATVVDGDLDLIGAEVDFIGLNYYFRRHVVAADRVTDPEVVAVADPPGDFLNLTHLKEIGAAEVRPRSRHRTMADWTPEPEGIAQMLTDVTADYGPVPIHITENGLPLPDYAGTDGAVRDPERITYLRDHLAGIHTAIAGGADVRGYFVWSLLDNLEWTSGFGHRFGLVHVDYATLTRTPKASFDWYAQVVADNAVPTGHPVPANALPTTDSIPTTTRPAAESQREMIQGAS